MWVKPGASFGASDGEYAVIPDVPGNQPEETMPCMLNCGDDQCVEWTDVWAESGEAFYHVSECEMLDSAVGNAVDVVPPRLYKVGDKVLCIDSEVWADHVTEGREYIVDGYSKLVWIDYENTHGWIVFLEKDDNGVRYTALENRFVNATKFEHEEDSKKALDKISSLMSEVEDTPEGTETNEGKLLERLSILEDEYEHEHYPIPPPDDPDLKFWEDPDEKQLGNISHGCLECDSSEIGVFIDGEGDMFFRCPACGDEFTNYVLKTKIENLEVTIFHQKT